MTHPASYAQAHPCHVVIPFCSVLTRLEDSNSSPFPRQEADPRKHYDGITQRRFGKAVLDDSPGHNHGKVFTLNRKQGGNSVLQLHRSNMTPNSFVIGLCVFFRIFIRGRGTARGHREGDSGGGRLGTGSPVPGNPFVRRAGGQLRGAARAPGPLSRKSIGSTQGGSLST